MGWLILFAAGALCLCVAGQEIWGYISMHYWGVSFTYTLTHLCLGIIFTTIGLFGIIRLCKNASLKPLEFPQSEYRFDYKVTTINNRVDTTYVLTKIK